MHTTSIQKLSFILFIFTNTQVYATNIRTIHNKELCKISVEKNLNASYELYGREREIKKEELRQQLLEERGYNDKKQTRNKLRKQVQRLAHIKKMSKEKISEKEQELLNTDKKLGQEIQNIEQSVEQQVARKYPYSEQKGHEYDTMRIFKEKLDASVEKVKAELDALRKKNTEETDAKIAEIRDEHETWMQDRAERRKKEEVKETEFFNKVKRIKKRDEQRQKYVVDKLNHQEREYPEAKAKHKKEVKAKRTKAIVLGLGTAGAIGISTFATGELKVARNVVALGLLSASVNTAIDYTKIKNKKVPDNRKTAKELLQEAKEHYPSSSDEDDSEDEGNNNFKIKKIRKYSEDDNKDENNNFNRA